MGQCIIMTGGSAGDTSDDCTASKSHVLEGYKAITNDSGDEAATGTMPNRGIGSHAVKSGINDKGLWYYISPGYYPGGATDEGNCWVYRTQAEIANTAGITAGKIMKNQSALGIAGTATSDANATADKIMSGYSGYVNGVKINGTLTVQSVLSFSVAQYSNLTLIASWAKPAKGPWSGLRVICKQGSYPTNAWDGTLFYEGSSTYGTKSLTAGTWYFRGWNYIETNAGRLYNNTYVQGSANNITIKGMKTFTQSGTFTVPANVYTIQAFVVGGGGGMHQSEDQSSGGGGGGYTNYGTFSVSPGQQYYVTIGAGGNFGSSYEGGTASNGGTTSFGSLISAGGGARGSSVYGGAGGSGGGNSGNGNTQAKWPGDGGENGSNGYIRGQTQNPTGPAGQGRTTRAFGEASGTLYAGGGGGGNSDSYTVGNGGAGGGGNGAGRGYNWPSSGSANTGGGAGGTWWNNKNSGSHQPVTGGSGIAIIRWGY